jgi:aspartyl-tRNA(Asn)/glutamyl-tRNA(Gln) amidotransferase subunit B
MEFEIVVGLEIHLQLNTVSKAFCADSHAFGKEANTQTSVVSLAHPGTLPVLNEKQVQKAVILGLALEGDIQLTSRFDRKHYFYPDLTKAYQITQEQHPISIGGSLDIPVDGIEKKVRIHHIHMEEDAGKSIHDQNPNFSLIDYNRAGVPLIEIVTEPDLRSGQEVYDFLTRFQRLARYLNISDANMEEGSMRCDCNVSVRPKGQAKYGQRCEIKNLNSRRFARQAVEYEAKRQIEQIHAGVRIRRDTRQFDTTSGKTLTIRSKEEAQDYRYFHDPDLPVLHLSPEYIHEIRSKIPVLAPEYRARFLKQFGLESKDIDILIDDRETAHYYTKLAESSSTSQSLAKLFINKVIPWLKQNKASIDAYPVTSKDLITFLDLIHQKKISHTAAYQQLLPAMIKNPAHSPADLISKLNLGQQSDEDQLKELAMQVIQNHPNEWKRFKGGKKGLLGFFVGACMKASKGKANPKILGQMFSELGKNHPG